MSEKKRLLLLNPWIYDFTACDFWLRPLGLLYLASIIREKTTLEVDFLDCLDCRSPAISLFSRLRVKADGRANFYKEEVPKPEMFRHIPRKFSRYGLPLSEVEARLKAMTVPQAVLLTCTMTYWYPGVQIAVELIRKVFGQVPIILGGIYATLCPEHARSQSGVDLVVEGPGENQVLKVLEVVCGTSILKSAAEAVFYPDFDSLPSPAYDLYQDNSVVCLMTSRGCPFKCTYCASKLLYPRFEQRNPEKVAREILDFTRTFNLKHVAFYDDALLLNKERHLEEILKILIQKPLALSFHTPNGLHAGSIDEKLALLLKRAGFKSLFLSLESTNSDWLRQTGPKVGLEDLERALFFLEKAGYQRSEISVYLLVGHPAQTREQVLESLRWVKKNGARPRLAYFSPVPGTEDWKSLVARGQLGSDPLLHNKLVFPYFWGSLTPEDLEDIRREAGAH